MRRIYEDHDSRRPAPGQNLAHRKAYAREVVGAQLVKGLEAVRMAVLH